MISRRSFLTSASAAALMPRVPAAFATVQRPAQLGKEALPFDSTLVEQVAERLSQQAYQPRKMVPKDWLAMNYDEYRSIWFNSNKALWTGSDRPFRMDMFHPGLYFPRPIDIRIVEDGQSRPLLFDLDLFDKTDKAPKLTIDDSLGYSGLRLRAELEKAGVFQEFCVFQGASYFRAIAKDQIYGLSARGLALKTADSRGEEFPDFTRFWIEAPRSGEKSVTLHALLDSPSLTGAYTFEIEPGSPTRMKVRCKLYPRADLDHVGLGPLTSMFLFDETNRNRFNDFRPAVHDNDGLLVSNGAGEMLWRPLANPSELQTSFFVDKAPRGFGLMQRTRKFSDFADLEALYHRRPGLWVEPGEDWGNGSVVLVEIPADREIYDNIVAFWRPREVMKAGSSHSFSYKLTWGGEPESKVDVARVINTRMGKRFKGGYLTTVDFEDHVNLADDPEEYQVHVSSSQVKTSEGILQRNPETGGLRTAFTFFPGERKSVELRAQLRRDGRNVSEVWLYRWTSE